MEARSAAAAATDVESEVGVVTDASEKEVVVQAANDGVNLNKPSTDVDNMQKTIENARV